MESPAPLLQRYNIFGGKANYVKMPRFNAVVVILSIAAVVVYGLPLCLICERAGLFLWEIILKA